MLTTTNMYTQCVRAHTHTQKYQLNGNEKGVRVYWCKAGAMST